MFKGQSDYTHRYWTGKKTIVTVVIIWQAWLCLLLGFHPGIKPATVSLNIYGLWCWFAHFSAYTPNIYVYQILTVFSFSLNAPRHCIRPQYRSNLNDTNTNRCAMCHRCGFQILLFVNDFILKSVIHIMNMWPMLISPNTNSVGQHRYIDVIPMR